MSYAFLEYDIEEYSNAEFLNDLDTRAYGKDRWLLLKPLYYVTLVRGYPELIVIPQYYITDLSSIPNWARWAIPVNDYHRWAGAVHDFLFDSQDWHDYSRLEVDQIFREAMEITPLEPWKCSAMYRAVRIGAGSNWKNNQSGGMRHVGEDAPPIGKYRW